MAERDTLAAQLLAARAAIDQALAALGSAEAPGALAGPDWTTLAIAAHEAGLHTETLSRHARTHGFGRRIGRAWHIDRVRLKAWREGRPFSPLMSEDIGNRGTSSEVFVASPSDYDRHEPPIDLKGSGEA